MSATLELFEAWKAKQGFETDSAASHALKVTRQTVNNWRSRNGNAEAHVIERMCRDLGRDPAPVMLQAFAEAAKNAEAARSLMRVARKLGAACLALLAVAPLTMHSSTAESAEGLQTVRERAQLIHYAKWAQATARAFLARCRSLTAPRPQPPNLEPHAWNRFASYPASP